LACCRNRKNIIVFKCKGIKIDKNVDIDNLKSETHSSPVSFCRAQWHDYTSEAHAGQPLSPSSHKFVQILADWYLNIGKPLPSVAAIQSAIRSEPTFIRNFRYRFHLSVSTSNKSLDRFRGIARLTKNNENEPFHGRMIDFDDRFWYGLLLR